MTCEERVTQGQSDTLREVWLNEEMNSGCGMINMTVLFSIFPFGSLFAQLWSVIIYI